MWTFAYKYNYLTADDCTKLFSLIEPYVLKHPNSQLMPLLFGGTLRVANNVGTVDQKKWINDFIDKVKKELPNTIASHEADKFIKNFK